MKKPTHISELTPSFFIGREGKNIISFGSGQPDFMPPKELFRFKPEKVYKYGPVQGDLKLRELIAHKEKVDPENVVITNGVSEGLDLCLNALLTQGDKVRLVKPHYYSYPHLTRINKGTPVFEGKAKVLMLNSPSNPSGKVYTKEEVEILREEAEFVMSDEIYSDLIYEGKFYSPRGEDVLNVNGFSKTFSLCGLRVGYICSHNSELIRKIVELKSFKSMNTSMISQEIAKNTFDLEEGFKEKVREMFRERRDYIYDSLKGMGVEVELPHGAFYIFPKLKDELVLPLFNEKEVITYPGRWFSDPDHIRLSYCTSMEKVKEGMKRIKAFLA
jgi:aspartate aminotransferase